MAYHISQSDNTSSQIFSPAQYTEILILLGANGLTTSHEPVANMAYIVSNYVIPQCSCLYTPNKIG